MKTITWAEFVALLNKADVINVDNVEVRVHMNKDAVAISWETEGEEWQFTFEKEQNENVSVKGISAVLFCNEKGVDAFNFKFFNLTPVTFN